MSPQCWHWMCSKPLAWATIARLTSPQCWHRQKSTSSGPSSQHCSARIISRGSSKALGWRSPPEPQKTECQAGQHCNTDHPSCPPSFLVFHLSIRCVTASANAVNIPLIAARLRLNARDRITSHRATVAMSPVTESTTAGAVSRPVFTRSVDAWAGGFSGAVPPQGSKLHDSPTSSNKDSDLSFHLSEVTGGVFFIGFSFLLVGRDRRGDLDAIFSGGDGCLEHGFDGVCLFRDQCGPKFQH